MSSNENLPLTCAMPESAAMSAKSPKAGWVRNKKSMSAARARPRAAANCTATCPSPVRALRIRPLSMRIFMA